MQQTVQTPSAEDTLLFRSFKLLQDFPTRQQLCSSSLLSHRNCVCMGTSPYTVTYRQGHAGGRSRAGPACRLLCHRELLRLSCGQGICAGHTGLKATLHLQRSSCQGQSSGFPGRKLRSTPMPPQHEVLTSSQPL